MMIAMHLFYIPDFVHNFRFHGVLWKQKKINKWSFRNDCVSVLVWNCAVCVNINTDDSDLKVC